MRLCVGTSNTGKFYEVCGALSGLGLDLVRASDCGVTAAPDEHGDSYAENALLKARWYGERSGIATVADDSGIVVDALSEELGIHTRRWGVGPDASDAEWVAFFLRRMEREENRRARFVCVIGYVDENGMEHTFEGTCDGVITRALEAPIVPGLPLSSCFQPDGSSLVYSAMKAEQKNSTSHRGKALFALRQHLAKHLRVP